MHAQIMCLNMSLKYAHPGLWEEASRKIEQNKNKPSFSLNRNSLNNIPNTDDNLKSHNKPSKIEVIIRTLQIKLDSSLNGWNHGNTSNS